MRSKILHSFLTRMAFSSVTHSGIATRCLVFFRKRKNSETNTVVRLAKVEDAAVNPNFVYNKGLRTSEITAYPNGTSATGKG